MFIYVLESSGMIAECGVVEIFPKTHVWYIFSIIHIICIACDSNDSGTIINVRYDDDWVTNYNIKERIYTTEKIF